MRGTLCNLIASNFLGGPEKQIINQSIHLRGMGWSVGLGSFREGRPSVRVIEAARAQGIPTFLIDTRSPFSPWSIRQLRTHLRRLNIDVLVTHGYKPNIVGYFATRRSGVLQIPMVRGYTAENRRIRFYETIDRALLRRFERVLCVSAATRETLVRYGLAAKRITVVQNAVDGASPVASINLREMFRLYSDAQIVVSAGRLSPEKGQRFLIEALALLRDRIPPVCAVILGSGVEEGPLQERIRTRGLEDRVILGGFREDAIRMIAGADLVVNPSLTEGMPNVLLEALSVGTPVVATDVGGVGELIIPGETGWLVPPADPVALAHAIRQALSNSVMREAAAKKGLAFVREQFSFTRQAETMDRYLSGALAGRKGAESQGSGREA